MQAPRSIVGVRCLAPAHSRGNTASVLHLRFRELEHSGRLSGSVGTTSPPVAKPVDALLVNGDELELTPDPPWAWMAPPVRLKLNATPGHRMKAKGQFVIWESEMVMAGVQAVGQPYHAPGFDAPGTVLTVTLIVNAATMSAAIKDVKLPVATVNTSGTFMATVVPAVNPSTGVPDPVVVKTGTWKVASNVQTNASSGQPKARAAEDDGSGARGGNADGSGGATSRVAERPVHFVAVQLQDIDGNKLAAHRVAVSTPDGRRAARTLTANGATRIDGIASTGQAVLRLLDTELRPSVKRPPAPWIGLTLLDTDGLPLEGVSVELVSPEGMTTVCGTNTKGAFRIDKLPSDDALNVRILGTLGGVLDVEATGATSAGGTDTEGAQGTASAKSRTPSRRLSLLELPDSVFRTDSCVVMPERQNASASNDRNSQNTAPTTISTLALALRLCEETPHLKLLVAGHTDSVDSVQYNQKLSQERSDVVRCILCGDRDTFKPLVNARHRVSDYKQLLLWCTRSVPHIPFTCDPGEIDDVKHTGVESVRVFQREYTYYKYNLGAANFPDLVDDGSMGPLTWGAIFDVFQYEIARELGETVQAAAKLRDHLRWVDDSRRALGFSEYHPIEAANEDNYESQSNRRVELLFFDERDILPDVTAAERDPSTSEIYLPGIYVKQRVPPRAGGAKAHRKYALHLLNANLDAIEGSGVEFVVRHDDRVVAEGESSDGWVEFRVPPVGPREIHVSWTVSGNERRYARWVSLLSGERAASDDVTQARLAALGYLAPPGDANRLAEAARVYQRDYELGDEPVEAGRIPASILDHLSKVFEADFAAPRTTPDSDTSFADDDDFNTHSETGCG